MQKENRNRGMVIINAEECKGCGLCVEVCPPSVLKISAALNRMGYHPAEYKGVECTGCGVCFYVCPEPGAITVHKRTETGTHVKDSGGVARETAHGTARDGAAPWLHNTQP